MHREIEETVCFVASFFYGTIPRSRVDSFSENLANDLAVRLRSREILHISVGPESILATVAKQSYLDWKELSCLLPKDLVVEIVSGRVRAEYNRKLRIIYGQHRLRLSHRVKPELVASFKNEEGAGDVSLPVFKVAHNLPVWTASDFCATRFGSAKLKTFPNPISGKEEARLEHPYTTPSLYSFLKYLIYLNMITLAATMHRQEEKV